MPDTLGDAWFDGQTGGSGFSGLSTKKKIGLGLGIGASMLPMLFGGGHDNLSQYERSLGHLTDQQTSSSQLLGSDSKALLGPVLDYLKAVTGGDRQAILQATMPERRRVIDQYATARRSLGEFQPRSGGTAAAGMTLAGQEAGDLSMIGAMARNEGVQGATSLGTGLLGASQQAANSAAANLGTMSNLDLQRQQQSAAAAGQWGQALGLLAGLAFV